MTKMVGKSILNLPLKRKTVQVRSVSLSGRRVGGHQVLLTAKELGVQMVVGEPVRAPVVHNHRSLEHTV